MSSWTNYWSTCKSRLSAISRFCYLSRLRWRRKFRKLQAEFEVVRKEREWLRNRTVELEEAQRQWQRRVAEQERQLNRPKSSASLVELPWGTPAPGQTYPVGLMVLSINLARVVGLRCTVRVLEVFFDWLNVPCRIPCYQTIRGWMQRVGMDRVNSAEKVTDGIWLVDHTNQIGPEKALTILRVRKSRLPDRGQPLRHQDVELLCCQPGTQWKRDDVQKVYEEVAAKTGHPVAILTDGAVELQEPAQALKKRGKSPRVLRDLKHFLCNQLEKLLTSDPQYEEFIRLTGQSRSTVQQTELAPFTAPSLKQKARFMNLKPMLDWASMTIWHLEHPTSQGRQGIAPERMEAKLGWLRRFAPWIKEMCECQQVISIALTFFNQNGIFVGSATKFLTKVVDQDHFGSSRTLVKVTVEFIRASEKTLKGLRGSQRLPISTEILESSFALYKQLEQQHAKGGFTSLLLVFATLLRPTTAREIQESVTRVKIPDVQRWLAFHLPATVASKRQAVYREYRPRKKRKKCATPATVAA